MNKTVGVQLVIYGLLLAGLGWLASYLAPTLARPTFIASLIGGTLCFLWGIRILCGSRGKALPILTLIPVIFTLVSQAVTGWFENSAATTDYRVAVVVITFAFLLSLAMLMRVAYVGATFDHPATGPTADHRAKPQSNRR